jgi:hypothetical protein
LRALQFFFSLTFIFAGARLLLADLSLGQIYGFKFVDVDGNTLSTADGHVTVVVLTTLPGIDKARAVGDRVPDYCLGNPTYRMITIVNFQKKRLKPMRMILSALMRRRLDAEAQRLQTRYTAKKITRDPRHDVFAVADFDGTVTAQFGARPELADFHVFVFGRNGELLQQWNDLPTPEQLATVVK